MKSGQYKPNIASLTFPRDAPGQVQPRESGFRTLAPSSLMPSGGFKGVFAPAADGFKHPAWNLGDRSPLGFIRTRINHNRHTPNPHPPLSWSFLSRRGGWGGGAAIGAPFCFAPSSHGLLLEGSRRSPFVRQFKERPPSPAGTGPGGPSRRWSARVP